MGCWVISGVSEILTSNHSDVEYFPIFVVQEGFSALWTGVGPNIARNAIVNAAELASYDQIKQVGGDTQCTMYTHMCIHVYTHMYTHVWPLPEVRTANL